MYYTGTQDNNGLLLLICALLCKGICSQMSMVCLVSCGRIWHSPHLTPITMVRLDTRHPAAHSYPQYMHRCQRPQVSMCMQFGPKSLRVSCRSFRDYESLCCHSSTAPFIVKWNSAPKQNYDINLSLKIFDNCLTKNLSVNYICWICPDFYPTHQIFRNLFDMQV